VIVLLVILWPLAEVLVAVEVARAIGVVWMLLALIAGWPLGSWVIRSQGRNAIRRLGAAIAAQRPPAREVLDGAIVLLAGMLLLIPGFITDALGALLVLPPVRALARRGITRHLRSRLLARAVVFGGGGQPHDVDSTAHDVPPPTLST
jgi:UPF0716 protein FxsA